VSDQAARLAPALHFVPSCHSPCFLASCASLGLSFERLRQVAVGPGGRPARQGCRAEAALLAPRRRPRSSLSSSRQAPAVECPGRCAPRCPLAWAPAACTPTLRSGATPDGVTISALARFVRCARLGAGSASILLRLPLGVASGRASEESARPASGACI
jgi:hypothetical protein